MRSRSSASCCAPTFRRWCTWASAAPSTRNELTVLDRARAGVAAPAAGDARARRSRALRRLRHALLGLGDDPGPHPLAERRRAVVRGAAAAVHDDGESRAAGRAPRPAASQSRRDRRRAQRGRPAPRGGQPAPHQRRRRARHLWPVAPDAPARSQPRGPGERCSRKMRRLARAGRTDDELRAIVDDKALAARARAQRGAAEERSVAADERRRSARARRAAADVGHDLQLRRLLHAVRVGRRARALPQGRSDVRPAQRRRRARSSRPSTCRRRSLDAIRCKPEPIAESHDARLSRLIDDPARWPFFTVHRLALDSAADWHGDHAPGVFQQLVVVEGDVELSTNGGSVGLGPESSAFIPATMHGGYRLTSDGGATVLAFAVPGPRGGISHD